ncbi:adenylyl-sulfate kinase [Nocardioides sp. InS609-2]|uniref:adenylyl-sulfate kinase n=1 Tax=Nocardioides sp. InS609-2 TaxID=2760705 RepID=UPI0020BEBD9F|nr:adenylyl-sulfate kinase [Nocardioides sp. InS609-2]
MSSSPAPTQSVPQHCPTQTELDDLELLTSGALAPTNAFNEWGSPVTLTLPDELAGADIVELIDPEGLPLARVNPATGAVEPLTPAQHGPFRRLHLSPDQVRELHTGATFVPVDDALTTGQLDDLAELDRVVLLTYAGHGTSALSPVGLVRATLAAASRLRDAHVVVVPLASHGEASADHALGVRVADNYASGDPVHALHEPHEADSWPGDIAEVVAHDQPEPGEQGLVVFFTGLSGSGKSTLAQALMDRILEQGERTVTSLDGDVVRRNLSAGLTFSKADRETNIRRIGWVAAEISRHGGVAVCSPIAPYDETRRQVEEMVGEAGGAFFLVHVATPLEECERRDRKGLYAKARAGEIPEFTGISSPYEEPDNAAVRVDTTGRTIEAALGDVLAELRESGHLSLASVAGRVAGEGRAGVSRPLKVLFVCTANICRSAFMEVTARHLVGDRDDIEFSSAGTRGFTDKPLDADMAGALTTGADHAGFTSRPVTRQLVDEADVILTAESSHRADLIEDHPAAFRKIFTLAQFAEAASTSNRHGRALIADIGTQRAAAKPEHDISDPYRRGPQAAADCGQRISSLLDAVIPALTEEA